jgi:hypothetical protein
VTRFRQILIEGGKVCTLRVSKGDDEMAAWYAAALLRHAG